TKNGNLVVVPNSVLARDTITNYSQPTADVRLELEVGAAYDTPPNDVKSTILEALSHEQAISRQDLTEVLVVDFAAYAITYRIRFWINDFAADDRVRDRVRSLIYYAFRRRDITIPYPIEVQIRREPAQPWVDQPEVGRAVDGVEIFAGLS